MQGCANLRHCGSPHSEEKRAELSYPLKNFVVFFPGGEENPETERASPFDAKTRSNSFSGPCAPAQQRRPKQHNCKAPPFMCWMLAFLAPRARLAPRRSQRGPRATSARACSRASRTEERTRKRQQPTAFQHMDSLPPACAGREGARCASLGRRGIFLASALGRCTASGTQAAPTRRASRGKQRCAKRHQQDQGRTQRVLLAQSARRASLWQRERRAASSWFNTTFAGVNGPAVAANASKPLRSGDFRTST